MNVTPTMQRAIDLAKQHGGKLHRHPGGFWAGPEWKGTHDGRWLGSSTIKALVVRAVADYTAWKEHKHSSARFPIEVSIR